MSDDHRWYEVRVAVKLWAADDDDAINRVAGALATAKIIGLYPVGSFHADECADPFAEVRARVGSSERERSDGCTDSERRLLDCMNEADAVLVYHDNEPSTIAWLKCLDGRPPLKFTVDYGHVDGERVVRRLQFTMGLTQKRFDAAVRRGREEG